MICTDDEKLEQRKNNLPKSTLLVSDRLAILIRQSDYRICAFKDYIMYLILEQHGFELHRSIYICRFFPSKYVPQYYMIHDYRGLTVKGHVDFRLHRGGYPTLACSRDNCIAFQNRGANDFINDL